MEGRVGTSNTYKCNHTKERRPDEVQQLQNCCPTESREQGADDGAAEKTKGTCTGRAQFAPQN